jgi:phage terminase large subunit GpA-like protein
MMCNGGTNVCRQRWTLHILALSNAAGILVGLDGMSLNLLFKNKSKKQFKKTSLLMEYSTHKSHERIINLKDLSQVVHTLFIDLQVEFPNETKLAWTRQERALCRKHGKKDPDKWAAEHMIMIDGPFEGGGFDTNLTPWLGEIMQASFHPSVRRVVICKAVQAGGTVTVYCCLFFAADNDQGNALIVYEDKDTASKSCRDRIIKYVDASPRLKALSTGMEDDKASFRVKLLTMLIYMGWSGSVGSLGTFPFKYLIKDETDKWTKKPGRDEAGSQDLADARVTAYPNDHKIWEISTPTAESGYIWWSLHNNTQYIFDRWVCCPDCGEYQVMIFQQIRWPGGGEADPLTVESEKSAYYVCIHNGCTWDDYKRNLAARAGQWRGLPTSEHEKAMEAYEKGDKTALDSSRELFSMLALKKPIAIGFHLPAWFSYFVSMSKSAGAFLRGQGATAEHVLALQNFVNQFGAKPFKRYVQGRTEDAILALCDDRPRGLVPGGKRVACLLAGVDVQEFGLYYSIMGIGYGLIMDLWLVREGLVENFEALEKVLWQDEYKDVEEKPYKVLFTVIDSRYRTSEVYNFCRKHAGFAQASMGQKTKSAPFSYSTIEFYPGTKKPFPPGYQRIMVDTNFYKNTISGKLNVAASDPGAFQPHSETTRDYAAQLCSEAIDEHGFWQQIGARPNHQLDCFVQVLVAADVKGVRFWALPESTKTASQENEKKSNWLSGGGFDKKGFLARR